MSLYFSLWSSLFSINFIIKLVSCNALKDPGGLDVLTTNEPSELYSYSSTRPPQDFKVRKDVILTRFEDRCSRADSIC